MTKSKFASLVTKGNITDAWDIFWKNSKRQTASGIDGITPQKFHSALDRNISQIYRQLKSGYNFSPLRPFPIEKPNGKRRIICIGTVSDRVVQRMLADYLTSQADKIGIINDVSFGFIKSTQGKPRGVAAARQRAVELRKDSEWAYKTDITAFFDNIQRDKLIESTVRLLRAESFRPILTNVIGCEIDSSDRAMNRLAAENGIVCGRGVRQGMPLSPLLSNIVLRDFDRGMINRGYKAVRYADDLIVLARSEEECREIDHYARESLSKIELSLPALEEHKKTQIVRPGEPIDFLGLSLSKGKDGDYKLLLTADHLKSISRRLGELRDIDNSIRNGKTFFDIGRRLDYAIGGYKAAYTMADNFEELERTLEKIRIDTVRGLLVSLFGEKSVQGLSLKAAMFMGIDRKLRT